MKFKTALTVLFSFLFLVFVAPSAAFADTYALSGNVSDSSENNIPSALVEVINPVNEAIIGDTLTDSSGNYTLVVPDGTYHIQVTPPAGSSFSPSRALEQKITSNKVLNFVLTPAGTVSLSGHIYDPLGNPVEGQTVKLIGSGGEVQSSSDGSYSFTVVPGTYTLEISKNNNDLSLNVPQYMYLTATQVSLIQSKVLDITIPAKKITVRVKDASGNPLNNVGVRAFHPSRDEANIRGLSLGGGITNASGISEYPIGNLPLQKTDANGNASLWLFENSAGRTYNFVAIPPTGSEFSQTTRTGVVISSDTTEVTLTPEKKVTLSGHVYDILGNPVSGQTIALVGSGNEAVTDSEGRYSLPAVAGTYTLRISSNSNDISLNVPQQLFIEAPNYSLTENKVLDITIPAKKIRVHAQDAFGNPLNNIGIRAFQPSFNEANIGGLSLGGGITNASGVSQYRISSLPISKTDAAGNVDLWLFENSAGRTYNFVAFPPTGSEFSQTTRTGVVISSDTTEVIVTPEKSVTLSGHVYDSLGNPVAGQTIALIGSGGEVVTDSEGSYSIPAVAGTYKIRISSNSNDISLNVPQQLFIEAPNYLLTEDTVLDLTIPAKKVTVAIRDTFGDPVRDIGIRAFQPSFNEANIGGLSLGGGITNASGVSQYRISSLPISKTDAAGNVDLWLFENSAGRTYNFVAIPPIGSIYAQFTLNNIVVSGEQTQVISLQYNHAVPVTSATLETDNGDGTYSDPTTITLSATADNGYTIASTYYKVDGGAQQTYTGPFEVSDAGEHTIEYWSVDNSGVQEAHKNKSFTIYENQAPTVDPIAAAVINNDEAYAVGGTFTDPDSASWTATVDYGEGAGPESLSLNDLSFNLNHTYAVPGEYTVSVVVKDDDNNTGTTTTSVKVNGAPLIAELSDVTIDSGDTYSVGGSFTDTDSNSWTASVNYGDGSGTQPLELTGQSFSLSHPYANSGEYTVTVTVTDSNGATDTETAQITVNNRPPMVDPMADVSINEGQDLSVNGSFTDSDSNAWTATVDYGEGAGPQALVLNGNNFTLNNTYESPSDYDVTIQVKDEQLNAGQTTFTVHVNSKPQIGSLSDVAINHQDTFVQSGSFEDLDSTSWTATVDYGDGSGEENLPLNSKNFNLEYTYLNPGTHTVTVKVTDTQGASDIEQFTVIVNAAAVINSFPGGVISEGTSYTHSGFFSDSDSTSWTGTVDYGDGSGTQPLTLNPDNTFALNHLYKNNGFYPITVSISDNQGAIGFQSALVTVNNNPTSIGAITAPVAPVQIQTTIAASVNFTDQGVLDIHTATWNWGDGSTSNGTVTESNGTGSVAGTHAYTAAGIYEVTITVDDGTTASLSQPYQYLVVVTPNTTKVNGGVDFNSPITASIPNLGKIDFGFKGDYINNVLHGGASMSFGNTNFKANSLDWLIINGNNVQLQATGTIKHQSGTYKLFISATDLAPKATSDGIDLVRVRLTNTADNTVLYDSQSNAPTTATPSTTISKGDIEVL